MNPPEEIERLRFNAQHRSDLALPADTELALDGIVGNSLELSLEIRADDAQQYGVQVCRSPGGEETTLVCYDATTQKLTVDTTRSSLHPGPKAVEAGPLVLGRGEPLKLRVFVDKSVVEVFANGGRQAVMRRTYPSRDDSLGVALFTRGGAATVTTLDAWELMPTNPY
jgi:sucrose-6-phosphate hydrolase SacC (GH32 family)